MTDYKAYCDTLYQDWLSQEQNGLTWEWQKSFNGKRGKGLSFEHVPEPYLELQEGEGKSLVLLTTNPGKGLCFQRKEYLPSADTYGELARLLSRAYQLAEFDELTAWLKKEGLTWNCVEPISPNARSRIAGMCEVSRSLGYDRLLQFELLPWHSESLPGKEALALLCRQDPWKSYLQSLRCHIEQLGADIYIILSSAAPLNEPFGVDEDSDWSGLINQTLSLDSHCERLDLSPGARQGRALWKFKSKLTTRGRVFVQTIKGSNKLCTPRDVVAAIKKLSTKPAA